jgi:hypothetical protein
VSARAPDRTPRSAYLASDRRRRSNQSNGRSSQGLAPDEALPAEQPYRLVSSASSGTLSRLSAPASGEPPVPPSASSPASGEPPVPPNSRASYRCTSRPRHNPLATGGRSQTARAPCTCRRPWLQRLPYKQRRHPRRLCRNRRRPRNARSGTRRIPCRPCRCHRGPPRRRPRRPCPACCARPRRPWCPRGSEKCPAHWRSDGRCRTDSTAASKCCPAVGTRTGPQEHPCRTGPHPRRQGPDRCRRRCRSGLMRGSRRDRG